MKKINIMNIQIRQANTKDIEKIQKLNKELFIHDSAFDKTLNIDWPLSEKGHEYFRDLISKDGNVCFIAEDETNPVGYVACSTKDTCNTDKWLELENMEIVEEYRKNGIGSKLIDEVKKWAKEKGFQKMYVSAYFGNTNAISFYKKNGFSEYDLGLSMTL